MKVCLRLFAGLREAVGSRSLSLELNEGSTVAALMERLAIDYPAIEAMLPSVVCAIDDEYVATDERLREGAEVALIPPVSGGAAPADTPLCRLTSDVLDAQALAERVRGDADGAIALFYGVVRNHNEGREVLRLEYEAHESMALKKIEECCAETKRRFPDVDEVGVWHRVGRLEIGETSLLVAVASPHRAEAFAACHWCVDRVKEVVPVWKKEFWADGSAWVEGHAVGEPHTAPA